MKVNAVQISAVAVEVTGGEAVVSAISDRELVERLAASGEPIARFFAFAHLPPQLAMVSQTFAAVALSILELPRNAERTVALRKLLEAKDAAVRAAMPDTTAGAQAERR